MNGNQHVLTNGLFMLICSKWHRYVCWYTVCNTILACISQLKTLFQMAFWEVWKSKAERNEERKDSTSARFLSFSLIESTFWTFIETDNDATLFDIDFHVHFHGNETLSLFFTSFLLGYCCSLVYMPSIVGTRIVGIPRAEKKLTLIDIVNIRFPYFFFIQLLCVWVRVCFFLSIPTK